MLKIGNPLFTRLSKHWLLIMWSEKTERFAKVHCCKEARVVSKNSQFNETSWLCLRKSCDWFGSYLNFDHIKVVCNFASNQTELCLPVVKKAVLFQVTLW